MWTHLIALAFADCMSGSLSVMPDVGSVVPPNPELVVHAYGTRRADLTDLRGEDLLLRSADGSEVPVTIEARHRGSFSDLQLVVRPEAPLPEGDVTLWVDGEALTVWHDGKHRPLRWRVGAETEEPSWAGAPALRDTTRELMGCGPAVWAEVAVATEAPWVDVELSPEGGETVSGRLPVDEGQVRIGHGMCSGMFELHEGVAYTAHFTAVGADGQRVEAPRSVRFVAE